MIFYIELTIYTVMILAEVTLSALLSDSAYLCFALLTIMLIMKTVRIKLLEIDKKILVEIAGLEKKGSGDRE